jgi:transcriptional regulator with XRE-family HTH domain
MKLAELRKEKGWSQSRLAKESGISTKAIQGYEQGLRSLASATAENVIKLAKALGISAEELIE